MIESIMYFGGGFLVASLLALVLISFVHHRAVRLTQRRLQDAIPVSMAEIQADKDSLRAEFAMSARRLEMNVEQLKAKATTQLGDIARKTEAINRLKAELAERTAVTDELDAKAKGLGKQIRETEQEYTVKAAAVESTGRQLAIKEAELAKAASDIHEQRLATDTQRVEIAVLKTQVEQYKSQIEEAQQDAQDAARRLFDERVAVSAVTKELEEKRQAVDVLHPKVAQLEREIATHTNELDNRARRIEDLETHKAELERLLTQRDAEVRTLHQEMTVNKDDHHSTTERLTDEKSTFERLLGIANNTVDSHSARIDDLERWVAERDRLLNQRDAEAKALHQEMAATVDEHNVAVERHLADKGSLERLLQTANHTLETRAARIDDLEKWTVERDELVRQRDAEIKALFGEIAALKEDHATAAEALRAEKAQLETRLQNSFEDRGQAQVELTALKHEAEATWRAERVENALLRERINDIAAQVAHMALAMDKSGSIEAILTETASIRPEAFEARPDGDDEAPASGNLTERIRKLQNGASRISTNS
jgi:chromosome segregation ATPase